MHRVFPDHGGIPDGLRDEDLQVLVLAFAKVAILQPNVGAAKIGS